MKSFLLLIFTMIYGMAISQDTVRTDNRLYSQFEKLRNQNQGAVTEELTELGKFKNLRIGLVVLKNRNNDTLSKAIKFDIRGNDLKIHVVPYRIVSYLDFDELDSLLFSLKDFVQKGSLLPAKKESTIFYSSRGGVYAACYIRNNTWRSGISTDPFNGDAMVRYNKNQLEAVIKLLESLK